MPDNVFNIIKNVLISDLKEENELSLPYQDETDEDIQTYSSVYKITSQDKLHNSYISDVTINYYSLNETQQLYVDVWKFVEDISTTTDESSGFSYDITNNDDELIMNYSPLLLDNNVPSQQRPSQSTYELHKLKVIWQEQDKRQNESQLESNITLTYVYGLYPNLIHITPGDIIKDPVTTQDYWIIQNHIQSKEFYDKINKVKVIIVTLPASRYPIANVPEQLIKYYNPDEDYSY